MKSFMTCLTTIKCTQIFFNINKTFKMPFNYDNIAESCEKKSTIKRSRHCNFNSRKTRNSRKFNILNASY
ncbi:hypothetical protein HanIR_Chr14g0703751 [Helianthus annuus]|nr:hypothetical protein HanIR_Chr14g0703751 [Helianthus annuus]